ncbi:MAG TPA: Bax inhibitor-1 family protein [Gemmatimonadaceae bacterium]|nr:Bax inhibitor-1 family protein [Gemmatimonadaceae bacterium]
MGYSYAPTASRVQTGVDRATLVRRTYGLVFVGVLTTIIGSAFTMTQPGLISAVQVHPFITFICAMAPLFLMQSQARVFPRNVILTLLFTFVMGVYITPFIMFAGSAAVGEAGVLTFTAFGVLSAYAAVSRRDFSAWGSFFMVGLVVLFVAMLLNFFVHVSLDFGLDCGRVQRLAGVRYVAPSPDRNLRAG